mmetsp:Transcript_80049/g.208035  ORF Transcript_80049/g.208035 Transcript_80049/m.208035 type:complete len:318 (+) Transcript_80049:295-1248(+)
MKPDGTSFAAVGSTSLAVLRTWLRANSCSMAELAHEFSIHGNQTPPRPARMRARSNTKEFAMRDGPPLCEHLRTLHEERNGHLHRWARKPTAGRSTVGASGGVAHEHGGVHRLRPLQGVVPLRAAICAVRAQLPIPGVVIPVCGTADASNALPIPLRVGGIVHSEQAATEGSFPEGAPSGLRFLPRVRWALVVAGVADDDVCRTARVHLVAVHWVRPLVRVHVAAQHHIHAMAIQQLLHVPLVFQPLPIVVLVAVVPWCMEHHQDPRCTPTVHFRQVFCREQVLWRGLVRCSVVGWRVAAYKAEHMHWSSLVAIEQG